MDVLSILIAVLGAVTLASVLGLAGMTLAFVWYKAALSKKVGYALDNSFERDASTYLVLTVSSLIDAALLTASAAIDVATIAANNFFIFFPYVLGAILALPVALIVVEYHPEIAQTLANVYQCTIVPLFYSRIRLFDVINNVRLALDALWGAQRFVNRLLRLFTRTFVLFLFEMLGFKLLLVFVYLANAVANLGIGLAQWIAPPNTVLSNRLNLTNAFVALTNVTLVLRDALDVACQRLDFLWSILLKWTNHPATSRLLSKATEFVGEVVSVLFRSFLKRNKGTVPGVTSDYGYYPDLNGLFDILNEALEELGTILNFFIATIVREIVGEFDTSLSQPGSQEDVVLASDWLGMLVSLARAFVELLRKYSHWIALAAAFLIQGIFFLISLIWSQGQLIEVGPNLFCDIREWRAVFDYGGPVSLFFKNGSVFGELYRAIDRFCAVMDYASPLVCGLVRPLLQLVVDFVNTVGVLPLLLIFPPVVPLFVFTIPIALPFILVRFISHLADSEWRMFAPPVPPRTPLPVSFWTPAPTLAPAPLTCNQPNLSPGFVFPWLQHYVDDPDGFQLLFVKRLTAFGNGIENLFNLFAPGFGRFLSSLFELTSSLYDFLLQTVFYINVVLFEPLASKALFFTFWRYQPFFDSFASAGEGIKGSIGLLDVWECTDVDNRERFFCALGSVFERILRAIRELGYQLALIVTTVFVPPLAAPNAVGAINEVEEAIDDAFTVLSIWVPPFLLRVNPTRFTVTDAVRELLQSFSPLLLLNLRQVNNIIYQLGVLATTCSSGTGGIQGCVGGFGGFFQGVASGYLANLKVALGDNALIGVGRFIDDLLIGGEPVFQEVFTAVVDILDAISSIFQRFAFTILAAVFKFIGTFLALIFGGSSSGASARVTNFLNAVADLVFAIFSAIPNLIIDLVFGIIAILLPEPLATVVRTVANLIRFGFCKVIQGFTDVVTDIINFFGAGIAKPNFCCDGGTSCSALKRKRDAGPSEEGMRYVRESIIAMMTRDSPSKRTADLKRRFERFRVVLKRFEQESPMDDQEEAGGGGGGEDEDDNNIEQVKSVLEQVAADANATTTPAIELERTRRVSLDQGIQLMTELVDWDGSSMCDVLVRDLNETQRRVSDLQLLERLTVQDCVTRRTLGEIFSILPYMGWFPKDGFYNPMRWLQLGVDAMRVYRIYAQYNSDQSMPRAVVLSPEYRESWSREGLRTEHLVAERYLEFMNWTLTDYIRYNNGNEDIFEAVYSAYNAFHRAVNNQAAYLENMSNVMMESQASANGTNETVGMDPVEAWLSGAIGEEGVLTARQQQQHLIWTMFLSFTNLTINVTRTIKEETMKRNLIGKGWKAVSSVPRALKRAYSLFVSNDHRDEWSEATKKRDAYIKEKRTFDYVGASDMTTTVWGRMRSAFDDWKTAKMASARKMLFTARTPRALRNRRIIGQIFSEAADLWSYLHPDNSAPELQPTSPPDVPPIGLTHITPEQWQTRVNQVRVRQTVLADKTRHSWWHVPSRVATYATGDEVRLSNGTYVAQIQICNASIVPFCLGCALADAAIAEIVIGVDEAASYYEPGGYFAAEAMRRYNLTRDYIDAGPNQTVCGGTGNSTIHFPSDFVVWSDGTTLFDLIGGNDGILGRLAVATSGVPSATMQWLFDSGVDRDATLAPLTAKLIENSAKLSSRFISKDLSLRQTYSVANAMPENRIFDYANSHRELDLNYILFDLAVALRPLLLALDAVGRLFTTFSVTFEIVFDPLVNGTTLVPVFDGSGQSGIIGFIINRLLEADYGYTCDRRLMSIFQGLLLLAIIYLVLSVAITLIIGNFSSTLTSLLLMGLTLALPFAFYLVVYDYPLSNLTFFPIPLLPICHVDDIVDFLVCEVIPKCPAVFAMAAKGPYTEQNCYGCPIADTGLEFVHCKRDLGFIDIIDAFSALVRLLLPQALSIFTSIVSFIPSIGPMIANRLNKFALFDLSDKHTFDNFLYCTFLTGASSLPTTVFFTASIVIVVRTAFAIVSLFLSKYAFALYCVVRYAIAVDRALYVGAVLYVPTEELYSFQSKLYGVEVDDPTSAGRTEKRKRRRRSTPKEEPGAPASKSSAASRTHGLIQDLASTVRQSFDSIGLPYYLAVMRGAPEEEIRAALVKQADKMRLNEPRRVRAAVRNETFYRDALQGF